MPRPDWRTLRRPSLDLDWDVSLSPRGRRNAKYVADLWAKRSEDGKTSITIVSLAVAAIAFIAKVGGGEAPTLENLVVGGGSVLIFFAFLYFPIRFGGQANRGAAFMTVLATPPVEENGPNAKSQPEDSFPEPKNPLAAQTGNTVKVAVVATAVGASIAMVVAAASRRSGGL